MVIYGIYLSIETARLPVPLSPPIEWHLQLSQTRAYPRSAGVLHLSATVSAPEDAYTNDDLFETRFVRFVETNWIVLTLMN
jgi:hypothetical protein